MKTIFPKPVNVIRTKAKNVIIPPGFVELAPGEVIPKEGTLYRMHDTSFDGHKNYYGNWMSHAHKPRVSIGEKYRPENRHHFVTIKPLPLVLKEDECWTAQIKFKDSKDYQKFLKKMGEFKFDISACNVFDDIVAVVSFRGKNVSWNYAGNFNNPIFGFPIDYATNAGKMQLKMFFDYIEKKNNEYLP